MMFVYFWEKGGAEAPSIRSLRVNTGGNGKRKTTGQGCGDGLYLRYLMRIHAF